jgi:hypothetical protein
VGGSGRWLSPIDRLALVVDGRRNGAFLSVGGGDVRLFGK